MYGNPYTGVAELLIVRSDLGYGVVEGCSGTLLGDGVSILTSAHCIADVNGVERATAAYVTFTTADGAYTAQAVSFKVDPAFNGSSNSPNDVAVLTLATPRTDDPLAGVVVPVATGQNPDADRPSHLQQVHAELVSQLPVPDAKGGTHHTMPELKTGADYTNYIRTRTAAWKAAKAAAATPAHP